MIVGIRPEGLEEASLVEETRPGRKLTGRVELREALGSELIVHFALPEGKLADTEETQELAHETSVEGGIVTPGALIVGRFGARGRAQEGENVEAVVDTSLLHFFDPETGLGIYDAAPTKGATS